MQELCIINSFDVMLAYLFICPKNKVKILINSRKKCLKKHPRVVDGTESSKRSLINFNFKTFTLGIFQKLPIKIHCKPKLFHTSKVNSVDEYGS